MSGKDFGKIVRYFDRGEEYPAVLVSQDPFGDASMVVFGLPGAPATYMERVDYSSTPYSESWTYIEEEDDNAVSR